MYVWVSLFRLTFLLPKRRAMKLREILEVTVPGLGYELVDVEITPAKMVRVFIDKEGGVTIDDCEIVSSHLNHLFFVEEVDYNRLEVSSPGIERPLRKLTDFARFKGQLAKIKTHELVGEQKVFQGIISDVLDNKVTLVLEDKVSQQIDFSNINRARLVYESPKNKKK